MSVSFDLVPCAYRQPLAGEPSWFGCVHPQVFASQRRVHAGICLSCQFAQEVLTVPPVLMPSIIPSSPNPGNQGEPCCYLGEQVGTRLCPTCRGTVQIKIFKCQHPAHSETTRSECLRCPDYRSPG